MSQRAFLDGKVTLYGGDSRDVLATLPDCSVDSVVTDPPYSLVSIVKRFGKEGSAPAKGDVYARATAGFMGKQWDTGETAFAVEFWSQVLRVLKPGGHVVAFSGTRTYHRLALAIEDAGFEIRDSIFWHYGSGFPKSHNVSKQLDAIGARCVCGKDVHHLPEVMDAENAVSSCSESNVFEGLHQPCDRSEGERSPVTVESTSHGSMRGVRQGKDHAAGVASKGGQADVLKGMQRSSARAGLGKARAQRRGVSQDIYGDVGREKPGLEGRRDLSQEAGELRQRALRQMPDRVFGDGKSGWLRDGAQACDGTVDRSSASADGMCSPHRPQPSEQPPEQLRTVAVQSNAQTGGAWPTCGRCGKPIIPDGLGTALKPATEPICLARKPLIGTVAANVQQHGVGALNIDGCRIEAGAGDYDHPGDLTKRPMAVNSFAASQRGDLKVTQAPPNSLGRWPANLIHDGSDEVLAGFPASDARPAKAILAGGVSGSGKKGQSDVYGAGREYLARTGYADDETSAARFFYQVNTENDQWYGEARIRASSNGHASDVENFTNLQSAAAVSVLSSAVDQSMPGVALNLQSYRAPSTSVTASELNRTCAAVTGLIQSIASDVWHGQQPEKLTLTLSHASIAATRAPTGIITITISPLKSNGSVDPVTFDCIVTNAELGVRGSVSRLHYTAKADADDRLGSKHPTVKPIDLMQYLVRLVTPRGGTVLDPFAGTGTTGEAAWREGMRAILIEREEEYQADIARRMDLATKPTKRAAVAKTKNQLDDPNALPLFATSEK